MLIARRLSKRFRSRTVFRDVSFEVASGQVAAVVGSNGAGKSTLLRIVAALTRPTQGEVVWRNEDAQNEDAQDQTARNNVNVRREIEARGKAETCDASELRWMCGLAAPDAPLPRELSASENLRFIARVRGLPHDAKWAEAHLERFGLRARKDDLTGDLSSGLRARLQLASATLHEPPILLLDEPSANLDEAGRALLQQVLDEQRTRGVVLLATNDEREIARCDFRIAL